MGKNQKYNLSKVPRNVNRGTWPKPHNYGVHAHIIRLKEFDEHLGTLLSTEAILWVDIAFSSMKTSAIIGSS